MTTRAAAGEAKAEAKAQTRRPWFKLLARVGMAARGVIFLIIGVLAIQVATDSGGETTGQGGALQVVADQPFGGFLLVLLAIGLACYAIWRIAQGILDTDEKGEGAKEWAIRSTRVASGVIYASLCVSAITILAGSGGGGSGGTEREATGGVLGWTGGRLIVVVAGLIVIGVGAWNVYRGLARKFMKRLHPPARMRRPVELVGTIGLTARGVVFGLIGVFLIKAAAEFDPSEAVGLDGALSRLAMEPYGKLLLGLVAAGLVAFALYCFSESRYREV